MDDLLPTSPRDQAIMAALDAIAAAGADVTLDYVELNETPPVFRPVLVLKVPPDTQADRDDLMQSLMAIRRHQLYAIQARTAVTVARRGSKG